RFPVMGLAGPVLGRLVLAGGFTTYLDRTWDVRIRDSMSLRGGMQPYTDELTSDGGVTNLRLAAALRVSGRLAIGAAVHVLSGSTRETATRTFDDTTYHQVRQNDEVRYDGVGESGRAGGSCPSAPARPRRPSWDSRSVPAGRSRKGVPCWTSASSTCSARAGASRSASGRSWSASRCGRERLLPHLRVQGEPVR